jgi:hypothetical protein
MNRALEEWNTGVVEFGNNGMVLLAEMLNCGIVE